MDPIPTLDLAWARRVTIHSTTNAGLTRFTSWPKRPTRSGKGTCCARADCVRGQIGRSDLRRVDRSRHCLAKLLFGNDERTRVCGRGHQPRRTTFPLGQHAQVLLPWNLLTFPQCVEFLISCGADVTGRYSHAASIANTHPFVDYTLLHIACAKGLDLAVIQSLVKAGADVLAKTKRQDLCRLVQLCRGEGVPR